MFKIIKFLIFCLIFINFGCGEDNVCIESLTSKFKSEIKSANLNSPFSIESIKIVNVTNSQNVEVFSGSNQDTFDLLLPSDLKEVIYKVELTFSSTNPLQTKQPISENLTIKYNPKNIYVSKSCGFKTNYKNLSYLTTGQLIISNSKTEINKSNETHLNLQF